MNKTVTINISGIVFHIEEDAFEILSKYLSSIKGYFSNTDGGSEIMSDIESRIAEILQTKISVSKQVILMEDVQDVMAIMGKPEDFGGETSREEKQSDYQQTHFSGEKIKRRLFRNPDDKAIGGVCSGLAAYFDIDTVWIRLAMFLLVFFGGLSLWVYIVLWLVMPEAKTTADKFAMRGESANINSIYRSFKEEAEDVKNRFNKYGKEMRNQNYGEAVRSNVAVVLGTIFNILGRVIGLFMILFGGVFLFAYVASLLGMSVLAGNADVSHWRAVIFGSSAHYVLGVFAFVVVVGIPVLMLIYTGVKLLFRIRYTNRWLNLSLGILWTVGFFTGMFVTIKTLREFGETARVKETFQLRDMGDTLVIKSQPSTSVIKSMHFENYDDVDHYMSRNHSGYYFGENNRKLTILGFAELNVSESNSDSVEMIISRVAQGIDKKEANENAKAIKYAYKQQGKELIFDEIYSVLEGTNFRAHDVNIKLKVPRGMVVYFDNSAKYLLEDIDNTANTWAGNMVDRRWVMTGRGLKCIDCDNLDELQDPQHFNHYDKNGKRSDKIVINEHGVHVNGEEAEVKIDKHGIKIHTPEKDVEINSDKDSEE